MGTKINIRIGLSAEILLSKINDSSEIVGKGIFKDSGVWSKRALDCFITFDSSSGDCLVEFFPSLQSAYAYLAHNKFCECSPYNSSGCTELFERGRSICHNCGLFITSISEFSNNLEWLKKKGVVLNSHDLFCFCKLVRANLCGCIEQPPHEVEIECARKEAFNEVFYRPIFLNQGVRK